jgi:hypothetical protein
MMDEDRTVQHGYGDVQARAAKSPLVFVQLRDGRGLGRWEDAASYQLRNLLDGAGLSEAASGVYSGFQITVAGLGAVVQDLLRVRGGTGDNSKTEDLLIHYQKWQKLVIRKYGMDRLNDCLAAVCHGEALAQIDRKRGKKHPHSRNNLIASLMLYQEAR